MNCQDCGLENPPIHDACAFCAESLGTAGDVEGRRAEWERLTPALRDEFSRNFERALEARTTWLAKLRRNRAVHAIAGACLISFLASLTHAFASSLDGFPATLVFLLDVAAGAGGGLALNHIRGGEYRGMAFFGGVYVASTALKLSIGALYFSAILGFLIITGLLAALCFGYLFGLNMSLQRSMEE